MYSGAIAIATGEFIALLDHDDLLTPHALYKVVEFLNKYPDADMIYSDEDKIDEEGKLSSAFFKPDWLTDGHIFFDTIAVPCHDSRCSYVKASNS